MTSRYFDNVVDQNGAPIEGATVYVYTQAGDLASIENSIGGALTQPLTTDSAGFFEFYADDGLYSLSFFFGGRRLVRDLSVTVGQGPELPAEIVAALAIPGRAGLIGSTGPSNVQADLNARPTSTVLAASGGSALVGFIQSGTGAIARTLQDKAREHRSILDFIPTNLHAAIAARTHTGDLSSYFATALAEVKRLYIPSGTYYLNATLPAGCHLYGDAARFSILKPFDVAQPVVTVSADVFWSYSRSLTDLQFEGAARTGIGVALGCTGPADYTAGDEFTNSVTFTRCRFNAMEKGVVSGAGNLGIEFYSCNWHDNYYGCYFLDNKSGSGSIMHAGCKYFFGGEFDYNVVGVYVHNVTAGFGGLAFHSTIIEANGIDVYCHTTDTRQPVMFIDCWTENASDTGLGPNVTVDTWTGSTKGTASLPVNDYVFTGSNGEYVFKGGFVSGVHLEASNSRVLIDSARVESLSAFNGRPFIVTGGVTSLINMRSCSTDGNVGIAEGVFVEDSVSVRSPAINGTTTTNKQFRTTPRFNKQTAVGVAGVALTGTSGLSATLSVGAGPASPVSGSVVTDGNIYTSCNSFTLGFTATGQFFQIDGSTSAAMVNGWWYVATLDVKVSSGTPTFYVGDLGSNQLMAAVAPAGSGWNTLAAIGQAQSTATMSLQVSSSTAASATFRLSAYQIRGFPTRIEAEAFLRGQTYVSA